MRRPGALCGLGEGEAGWPQPPNVKWHKIQCDQRNCITVTVQIGFWTRGIVTSVAKSCTFTTLFELLFIWIPGQQSCKPFVKWIFGSSGIRGTAWGLLRPLIHLHQCSLSCCTFPATFSSQSRSLSSASSLSHTPVICQPPAGRFLFFSVRFRSTVKWICKKRRATMSLLLAPPVVNEVWPIFKLEFV